MYGVIAFNKEEQSPFASFGEFKRYGRGSACKGCRVARVKCTGKLGCTDCERCKRLGWPCQYTDGRKRRSRGNGPPVDNPREDTASNEPIPPDEASPGSPSSARSNSPPLDTSTWDELPLTTSDGLDFGFDMWMSTSSPPDPHFTTESLQAVLNFDPSLQADSGFTPSVSVEERQPERLSGISEPCETYASHFPDLTQNGSNDGENGASNKAPSSELVASGLRNDVLGLIPAVQQCRCHQTITSLLSILRGWTLGEGLGGSLQANDDGTSLNNAKVEEFLGLFEKSMVQLQTVEGCPQVCILSQDLAILLLLVVEQLAKLLLRLAANYRVGSFRSPTDVSPKGSLHLLGVQGAMSESAPNTQLAKIGSFETKDPQDLHMIKKLLLQIRSSTLDAYICRWSDRVKHSGLKSLEIDLRGIRAELSKVTGGETGTYET
ncbi:hypothetical protein F5Y10DRAFT_292204 [Nemania abortiva]|nr:hypothetical protein F5Y10DRAFT_292204 [Nemania abortiva]